MPKEVKAYKCRYCDAVSMDAGQAERDEAMCPHNPALECCANCVHMQVATAPRFENRSYPVRVCAMPPEELDFTPPHDLGWCPNWGRNPAFERSAR